MTTMQRLFVSFVRNTVYPRELSRQYHRLTDEDIARFAPHGETPQDNVVPYAVMSDAKNRMYTALAAQGR